MLYNILGENRIKVNSRHNKHIVYTDLDCVAYSKDGILEGVEDKTKKFFIGVQWHPESISSDVYSNRLLDYFINAL